MVRYFVEVVFIVRVFVDVIGDCDVFEIGDDFVEEFFKCLVCLLGMFK